MDMQEAADKIREKHYDGKGIDDKERVKNILSKRDQAIKTIEDFQDKTGIPTDDEVDGQFLDTTESGMTVEEYKENEDKE